MAFVNDDDDDVLRRLARAALVDDTAAVRNAGVGMLPAAMRALGTGSVGQALREDVAALASSGVFRQRMTCVDFFHLHRMFESFASSSLSFTAHSTPIPFSSSSFTVWLRVPGVQCG